MKTEELARKKLEALYLAGERELPVVGGIPQPLAAPPPAPAAAVTQVAAPAPPLPQEPRMPQPASLPRPVLLDPREAQARLEEIRADIGDCKRCRLCEQRNHIVFGVGNPRAELMFVGEAPGRDEDLKGEPFVGRAGQLLTKIIEAMKFKREDVYIANVVKCLRYNAMVQLGDGSWERIGRLVRKKYDGTVMSVDETGRIAQKKVIGWHSTPLDGRPVYKLSYKSAKKAGAFKRAIYLTGDHPVLTKRGYVQAQALKPDDEISVGQGLSQVILNLIFGSLLGDGHIRPNNAHFSFSHSIKQEDYALFKANLLQKELGGAVQKFAVAAGGDQQYPIVSIRTKAHRSLGIVRELFYSPKKKVPDQLSTMLNPMMLAFWFMDDGYMRIRPPRKPSAEIATCAFSEEDLTVLLQGLANLGIQAYAIRGRIHFNIHETIKLSEMIAPYVPSFMRWKLHPEVEPRIPFNPTFFESGEPISLYDNVDIERVEYKGADKTFFCIDVEETHNFVTSGGVVHNCRPPENRNPAPDEIATCEPYLLRQIETIQPKAIVGLGNFAVQTLLQTEAKITGLRGRFHPWPSAVVKAKFETSLPEGSIQMMPTYHPAFLLRNPAMKRPVWEDMQKVMELLKKS